MAETRAFMRRVLDFCLPPRCPVTGEAVSAPGLLSPAAWAGVQFVAEPYCKRCGVPFEVVLEEERAEALICQSCEEAPPPYRMARAAALYDDASKALILRFKHGDHMHMRASFSPWLARAGAEFLREADCFIPVPLHYWRLVKRRYNQASVLARGLVSACGLDAPVYANVLQRARPTQAQGHLSPEERAKNVAGAFAVPDKKRALIAGKACVLIDDVYTTGVTVKECARVLLEAGAAQVDVLTIARTDKVDPILDFDTQ